ncbi:Anthocyanidin 3-O-glucosyltransferase 6 [Hibiscus syriacus]|uniref:Anthocyanidin 3-O-glucosyltransferase 6 n=1 Tax=Hibiscus syriacus TaxID=106335 RepID=A0A6A3CN60_HIBSY|nr:Anthocyanidin 3-O-glucosyltransferase 6 [Hibiscus syriacus]
MVGCATTFVSRVPLFRGGGSFNGDQVKEIACALEQSAHRFLWSLRQPPDPSKGPLAAPTNYDDLSEVAILGHPGIGGVVSHCGWNSALESIWFGVPMETWPLYAEQLLNAFELVTELGLAVEIKMDYRKDDEIVRAEKIEKGI